MGGVPGLVGFESFDRFALGIHHGEPMVSEGGARELHGTSR
jgi:hypothetical protein